MAEENPNGSIAEPSTTNPNLHLSSNSNQAEEQIDNVNFWIPSSLKKAVPCIKGKGRIHPTPPYLTSIDKVNIWRRLTQDEQKSKWRDFKLLSVEEQCINDNLISGNKPKRPYIYKEQDRSKKGPVTRGAVQTGSRSLRRRGRPKGSKNKTSKKRKSNTTNTTTSTATSTTTSTDDNNQEEEDATTVVVPEVSPESVIANNANKNSNQQKKRKASSRPTSIQQTKDTVAQKQEFHMKESYAKYVETSTIVNTNTDYARNDNPVIGSALVLFSRVKPTGVTGAKHKKQDGGVLKQEADVQVICSSQNCMKYASMILKAAHEHTNKGVSHAGAENFTYYYPEQDATNPTHLSDMVEKDKLSWKDTRKAPKYSIVDSSGTNHPDMADL